jgi:hypothetical protein
MSQNKSYRQVFVTTVNSDNESLKLNHKETISQLESIGFIIKSTVEEKLEDDLIAFTSILTHSGDCGFSHS